jgi:hypothetical protein
LEAAFMPAIAHAEVPAEGGASIAISDFEDLEPATVGAFAATLPADVEGVFLRSGADGIAAWQPLFRLLEMFDAETGAGYMFTSRRSMVPGGQWASPFRHIVHWMTVPTPYVVVHGASLFHGGTGLLLAGVAGAGKSTTTARALGRGFVSAGDDMLMVDTASPRPVVHALYDAIKLDSRIAGELTLPNPVNWIDVDGTGAKKFCRISDLAENGFARTFELGAILVPRISAGGRSRIASASPTEGLRALAPSTLGLFSGGEQESLAKLGRLVRMLPTFRLELGADPQELGDVLGRFCADLRQ